MKKRIVSLLAIAMLCCACSAGETVPAANEISVISQAEQAARPDFSDIPDSAWYAEAASWCKAQGILLGDTLSPDTVMTRATVAEALYRAAKSPAVSGGGTFSDIEAGSIYARAAAWTSANGIMSGYGGGIFGVNDPVTREQMAAILWRYAGSPSAGNSQNFADGTSIAS